VPVVASTRFTVSADLFRNEHFPRVSHAESVARSDVPISNRRRGA
jgi:hypothetical protein